MDLLNALTYVVAVVYILAGLVLYIFPPLRINYFYGYRTPSAMKNIDRWRFAQKKGAVALLKYGTLLAVLNGLVSVLHLSEKINEITCIALIILLTIAIFVEVERAIVLKFKTY